MQRNYPYRGYVISVSIEHHGTSNFAGSGISDSGCDAVVQIFIEGSDLPCSGPIHVTEHNGRRFGMQADALLAGSTAGQRAIDELLLPRR
jgi:hypothetical protein